MDAPKALQEWRNSVSHREYKEQFDVAWFRGWGGIWGVRAQWWLIGIITGGDGKSWRLISRETRICGSQDRIKKTPLGVFVADRIVCSYGRYLLTSGSQYRALYIPEPVGGGIHRWIDIVLVTFVGVLLFFWKFAPKTPIHGYVHNQCIMIRDIDSEYKHNKMLQLDASGINWCTCTFY